MLRRRLGRRPGRRAAGPPRGRLMVAAAGAWLVEEHLPEQPVS
ncbi:hypothetical protein AB0L05_19145 [Nonomuraea pusilla]